MRFIAMLIALIAGAVIAIRLRFRGPGDDVLLPPGTPPDWRERAKQNNN